MTLVKKWDYSKFEKCLFPFYILFKILKVGFNFLLWHELLVVQISLLSVLVTPQFLPTSLAVATTVLPSFVILPPNSRG